MIVVGFTGPAGAGKDTAAGFLREYLEQRGLKVRTQAWADKLKVAAAAALGFYGTDEDAIAFCDRLKVHGKVGWSLHEPGEAPEAFTLTGREFLEKFGTEGGRNVYGEDHWIDLALPAPSSDGSAVWRARAGFPNAVIDTTTRFPNEVARIRAYQGQVWRVERAEAELRAAIDGHPSRAGIPREDCDVVIANDGSLDELKTAVEGLAARRLRLPV
jgi:hypothetical protein